MTLIDWDDYLRDIAAAPALIERFLTEPGWAVFDAELGYLLQNSSLPMGIDGTSPIETFDAGGARSRFMYAGATPRINCYGNSFTESMQVGDGETWEEYLAGHLAEPVGNYGIGGHGVYQAYRRMIGIEPRFDATELVVLYIWGDDPLRSLLSARWVMLARSYQRGAYDKWGLNLHGGPWAHLALDLETGRFTERENLLPTAESLTRLSDPEWVHDAFVDDDAARIALFLGATVESLDRTRTDRLAEILEVPFDWTDRDLQLQSAENLIGVYQQRATNLILDKARAFTEAAGKKLLVALNFTDKKLWKGLSFDDDGSPRSDQLILDHLAEQGIPAFDMNEVHRNDHARASSLTFPDYMAEFLVDGAGHYNPRGNHVFAYAIRDALVPLLDPSPAPYRRPSTTPIDWDGYLPRR